jgi:hypothetical protein
MLGHRTRGVDVVHHDRQVDALLAQRSHSLELAGRYAYTLEDVAHAAGGKLLRFQQG